MKVILGLCLIFFVQMLSSCQRAEPETYLIPSSFTGRVQIIFNQNGIPYKYKNMYGKDTVYTPRLGEPIKYENGRRIYEIPLSGILLTQFKSNPGFIDTEYYSVDSNGKREPLEIFKFEHFKKDSAGYVVKDENQKGIFGNGTSGSIGNEHIPYQEFVVSDYKHLNGFLRMLNSAFDERVEQVLNLPHWLK